MQLLKRIYINNKYKNTCLYKLRPDTTSKIAFSDGNTAFNTLGE